MGQRARGAGYLASVAGSKGKDGALQVVSTAAHLRHHRDTAFLVAFFLLFFLTNLQLICAHLRHNWASLVAQTGNNLPAKQKTQVQSLHQEDHWKRTWPPIPVYLPEKPHGQRSLVGYTVHGLAKSWTQLSVHGINYTSKSVCRSESNS